ncbi:MAG: hypothetical protein HY648_14460 [Acidobacteria bacterium]|nr:hypothetical protein [Acidobacteriota bacterium]
MRTLMAVLLGGWLFGILIVAGVAAENFRMIDSLLDSVDSPRPFLNAAARLEATEARTMLRYVASEVNRFYFRMWEWIELVLGGTLLTLASRKLKNRKLIIAFGLMVGITLLMRFYLTPGLTLVGRTLDFAPRNPAPPGLAYFGLLHATYSMLDLVKLLIGIWATAVLVRPGTAVTRDQRKNTVTNSGSPAPSSPHDPHFLS